MRWIREGWRRLRSLTRADGLERGLDEEIRFHIERQTDKNLRAGMTPDEARRQAYIKFGGVERVKESTRDEFRPALVQDSLLDLRYGVRALRRAPVFTLVAALTLALGIGATTAVFTVVHGVLIKPLPFRDSDALVSLKHTANGPERRPARRDLPFTVRHLRTRKPVVRTTGRVVSRHRARHRRHPSRRRSPL